MTLDEKIRLFRERCERLYPPRLYRGRLAFRYGSEGDDPFLEVASEHFAHVSREVLVLALQLDLAVEPNHEGEGRVRFYLSDGARSLSAKRALGTPS